MCDYRISTWSQATIMSLAILLVSAISQLSLLSLNPSFNSLWDTVLVTCVCSCDTVPSKHTLRKKAFLWFMVQGYIQPWWGQLDIRPLGQLISLNLQSGSRDKGMQGSAQLLLIQSRISVQTIGVSSCINWYNPSPGAPEAYLLVILGAVSLTISIDHQK